MRNIKRIVAALCLLLIIGLFFRPGITESGDWSEDVPQTISPIDDVPEISVAPFASEESVIPMAVTTKADLPVAADTVQSDVPIAAVQPDVVSDDQVLVADENKYIQDLPAEADMSEPESAGNVGAAEAMLPVDVDTPAVAEEPVNTFSEADAVDPIEDEHQEVLLDSGVSTAAEIPSPDDVAGSEENGDIPETPTAHEHGFILTERVEPTCELGGREVYICICGERYEKGIDMCGHSWELSSEYEVIDKESFCRFTYAEIWCTSPFCYEDGDLSKAPLTCFSAEDYGYSAERMFGAYNEHEKEHLLKGEQGSYTTDLVRATAPADMYEYLQAELGRRPRAVIDLALVPAVTHTEQSYRCSRCGAEK